MLRNYGNQFYNRYSIYALFQKLGYPGFLFLYLRWHPPSWPDGSHWKSQTLVCESLTELYFPSKNRIFVQAWLSNTNPPTNCTTSSPPTANNRGRVRRMAQIIIIMDVNRQRKRRRLSATEWPDVVAGRRPGCWLRPFRSSGINTVPKPKFIYSREYLL